MGLARRLSVPIVLALTLFSETMAHAQTSPRGLVTGTVVDSASWLPVAGAQVWMDGAARSVESDQRGAFVLLRVSPGTHTVRASRVGYETSPDIPVAVPDTGAVHVQIALAPRAIPQPSILVIGEGPRAIASEGTSVALSPERIRRNPGTLSDISRAVSRIPEVTPLMDVLNLYSVRGGAPLENGFNIDGIDLTDISHLPNQGSSGGAVGLINPEFVEELRLHAGAFDPAYGGRMSSILDVDWRNPGQKAWHGTVDLSVAGGRLSAEGPVGSRASVMLCAHHSYLDRLLDESGVGVTPRFNDYQGKVVYRPGPRHTLSALGILGVDNFEVSRETAIETDNSVFYGEWDALPHAAGLKWESEWSDKVATRMILSRAVTAFDYHFWDTRTVRESYLNTSTEAALTAKSELRWDISPHFALHTGSEWKRFSTDIRNEDRALADRYGRFVRTAILVDRRFDDGHIAGFANSVIRLGHGLEAGCGGRLWYYSRTDQGRFEPRARLGWRSGDIFEVGVAAGSVHQQLPYTLLAQRDSHSRLSAPRSDHLIGEATVRPGLGVYCRLGLYRKIYHNLPMDPSVPRVFVLDEIISREFFHYAHHPQLRAEGVACSRGGEFLIGREAEYGFRGFAGVALSDAKYRDLEGRWRERLIDIEHAVTAEAGFRTRNGWTFAAAWRQIGGLRRTPYDVYLSSYYQTAVEDAAVPNLGRLPTLHWLDLRLERQFRLGAGHLTLHAGVWNAYEAKEITVIFWSNSSDGRSFETQFPSVPVFGVIYSF